MPKRPAFMFYTGDWLKDPALGRCSPDSRGVWLDLLCAIHECDSEGSITGTAEELSRICRCSRDAFVDAADELRATHTAEITEREGVYTVISRRMRKEAKSRKQGRLRQRKFRVTQKKRESNSFYENESEIEDEAEKRKVRSFTLQQVRDAGNVLGVPEAKADVFYYHYNAQGWLRGNGQPITNLQSMMQNWKRNGWELEGRGRKERLLPIAGKVCSKRGCGMPAVYKDSSGSYDYYYCAEHMPQKVKDKYG